MDKRFDPTELYGFTVDDAVVIVGNLAVEQRATFSPNAEFPDASAHLQQALAQLACEGKRLQITIEAVDGADTNTKEQLEKVQALLATGLNPNFCTIVDNTLQGTPRATVTQEHFQAVDYHQGFRAYNALSQGANTPHYGSTHLEQFVVRSPERHVIGFDAKTFGTLASDWSWPQLAGIRNFGQGSWDLVRTLSQRLYLDPNDQHTA